MRNYQEIQTNIGCETVESNGHWSCSVLIFFNLKNVGMNIIEVI